MPSLRTAVLAAGLLAAAACRIEDRTPTGSRRDEEQIRALVDQYYRAASAHRWGEVREVFWDSAAVELLRPPPAAGWRDFRSADEYLLYLRLAYGGQLPGTLAPRIVRTDFRQQGELAAVWVLARLREPGVPPEGEIGRTDHFVFRRIGDAWRVVHLASMREPDAGA